MGLYLEKDLICLYRLSKKVQDLLFLVLATIHHHHHHYSKTTHSEGDVGCLVQRRLVPLKLVLQPDEQCLVAPIILQLHCQQVNILGEGGLHTGIL